MKLFIKFLPLMLLMFSSISSASLVDEVDDQLAEDMKKAVQTLFKKNSVSEPAMIMCYRKAMRGDKEAVVNAFILAKADDFSREYMRVIQNQIEKGVSPSAARSRLDSRIIRSEKAMKNYKYLIRSEAASSYCQSLLDSDPEEAKIVESIVNNLRKSE